VKKEGVSTPNDGKVGKKREKAGVGIGEGSDYSEFRKNFNGSLIKEPGETTEKE